MTSEQPEGLVNFGGRGQYHSPQLTWLYTIGPTAIKFLDSDKYGANYENDLFVGDIHAGNMYHFKLNQDRTELVLPEPLSDKIADTEGETVTDTVLFATGFAGISDIEVSPYDGYMYVVSLGQGKIFRILPANEVDTSADGVAPPSSLAPPAEVIPPIPDDEDQADTEGQDMSDQENENDDEDDEDDEQ